MINIRSILLGCLIRALLGIILLAALNPSALWANDNASKEEPVLPPFRDSTQLGPLHVYPDPGHGFVLARGSHQMFCGGSERAHLSCDFQVSYKQCPEGFYPQAMFAPRRNGSSGACSMRGYVIDAPLPWPNVRGGYSVSFKRAYANFVSCQDRGITVTYTVMCLPNPEA